MRSHQSIPITGMLWWLLFVSPEEGGERIFTILCALALVMAGSATALAAEPEAGQSASYYPVSVEEYTYGDFDELRINKTYFHI